MSNRQRPAYTLLEILVALTLAILLMSAVYTAYAILITQIHSGRNVVNQANVTRGIFSRFAEDVNSQMAPVDPRLLQLPDNFYGNGTSNSSSTTSTSGTGSSGNTAATTKSSGANTGTTNSNATGTTGSGSNASTSNPPSPDGPQIFNLMVQGNSERVMLFVTKLPQRRLGTGNSQTDSDAVKPDQLRISYWMVNGGNGGAGGLARQQVDFPTSDDALTTKLDDLTGLPEQEKYIISRDVVSVKFEYWDGSSWQSEWYGDQANSSNTSSSTSKSNNQQPMGPPMAIAMTVEVRQATSKLNGETVTRTFRHVVPLPAANGIALQGN